MKDLSMPVTVDVARNICERTEISLGQALAANRYAYQDAWSTAQIEWETALAAYRWAMRAFESIYPSPEARSLLDEVLESMANDVEFDLAKGTPQPEPWHVPVSVPKDD